MRVLEEIITKWALPFAPVVQVTGMPRLLPLILKLSLPLIVIDQLTKWWIVLNLQYGEVRPVIEGFFNINRVHNQGVAFGMGNGTSWAPVVFMVVPFIALTVVSVLWKKGMFVGISKWSAPLLVAGVIGNLLDRLFQGFFLEAYAGEGFWTRLSEGYVVDFLDFTIPLINYRWPSFNVADSCICIAASLLFISAFQAEANAARDGDKA